jgi:hypothetical protein
MKFRVSRRLALSSLLLPLLVLSVYADSSVDLGTAGCFGVLAGSTVTNTGYSVIPGNVGVWPGTAVVGFPPGIAGGTIPAGSNADTSFLTWIDCQDWKVRKWPDVTKSESAVEQFKKHLEQLRFETLAPAQPRKQSRNSVEGRMLSPCAVEERSLFHKIHSGGWKQRATRSRTASRMLLPAQRFGAYTRLGLCRRHRRNNSQQEAVC